MRVPADWAAREDVEIVVRFSAPGLKPFEAAKTRKALLAGKPPLEALRQAAGEALQDHRPADAKTWHLKAAELYPDNAGALNSCAWFLLTVPATEVRDPARALPLARKAVELTKEKNGAILDTLAVALHDTGALQAAAETEARAARLEPDSEDVVARAKAYQAEWNAKRAAPPEEKKP